jgi:AcrR family transcriptional regulator
MLSSLPWLDQQGFADMGSQERRTRERAETRQIILDAAREMFVQHGYEDTTMRAIADQIEFTPTAIYHHFENKEALLGELCAADFRALSTAFQRIGRIEDPVERLARVGETYVDFALEHPMQYQLIFMTRHPQVVEPGESAYGFLLQTCKDAIASGRLRPEFSDPDELAQIAWSSLHGLLALYIVKQEKGKIRWCNPRTTAAQMRSALIRGLLRGD